MRLLRPGIFGQVPDVALTTRNRAASLTRWGSGAAGRNRALVALAQRTSESNDCLAAAEQAVAAQKTYA